MTSALTCAEVVRELPGIFDEGARADDALVAHVEGCLLCQAELVRYRRLLGLLAQLRSERPPLPAGMLEQVLAALEVGVQRHLVRSALSHRRAAYGSGLVLSGVAAAAVVVLARTRRATTVSRAGGA